jgi:hypothetical protein
VTRIRRDSAPVLQRTHLPPRGNKSMATTDNLQVLASPNREFGMQVLRHLRADGTPVYTIGIWEEGVLRCICHAHPIARALLALSREFEATGVVRSHRFPIRATDHVATTSLMISVEPAQASDTPSCLHCGCLTNRNGSCYICANCGSTTGCS